METFKSDQLKNEKGQVATTQEEMDRATGSIPVEVILEENQRECTQEIMEFKDMITVFEATYSIEELNAITDLTPEDAPNHPIREPARLACNQIFAKLNVLAKETNITAEKYDDLKKRWNVLSNAVGIIINDVKVDHNR